MKFPILPAAAGLLATFLAGCTCCQPTATASKTGKAAKPETLFDGQTLNGWAGLPGHWKVQEGAIIGYTTALSPLTNNTFLVWTNGTVGDFELHAKYKMIGGNSGIQYRSQLMDPEKFIVGGYQADIDSSPRYTGILYEERGRGILAERGQRTVVKNVNGKTEVKVVGTIGTADELQKFIKQEDWNDYVVVAKGNHLMNFINGHLMSDVVDLDSAHGATNGIIALQIHVGPPMQVQFKDIQLYRLEDSCDAACCADEKAGTKAAPAAHH